MAQGDVDAIRQLCRTCRYRPRTIIEVGSFVGMTSLVLAERADVVLCIDTWDGPYFKGDQASDEYLHAGGADRIFKQFRKNTAPLLYQKIFPLRGSSLEFAFDWPFQVELIFIDANHHYEFVKRDIEAWLPHVMWGGVLAGHDYSKWEGVTRAVDELLPKRIVTGESIWRVEK